MDTALKKSTLPPKQSPSDTNKNLKESTLPFKEPPSKYKRIKE